MNYHNSSFAEDLLNEFNMYSNLGYSIDPDEDGTIELSIHSTSMSENDGSEEGVIGGYSYMDKQEALEDVKQACEQYAIDFEDIDTDINFYNKTKF